ncbi:MAG: FG-GAP-like repeat-containing protein [Tunicatimonas sp.]
MMMLFEKAGKIGGWLGYLVAFGMAFGAQAQPRFTDVTPVADISHFFRVYEGTFGGGAVVIDYDADGFEDLFMAGGAGASRLYRNQGDGTFADVSEAAGLDLGELVTQGGATADVNKDGYPDLFVTTIASLNSPGPAKQATNQLFINNGDGTFSEASAAYGLTELTFSTGASFGDVNRDGYPDLYVSNYFRNFTGRLDRYGGNLTPDEGAPGSGLLYINNGGERFTSSAEQYGIDHTGFEFSGVWSDYDNDRDLDLLIVNDFGSRATPNLLYRNDYPAETFTEVGAQQGFDLAMNGMGISVGDHNGDGWLDYFVTNIQKSPFLTNQAGASFVNETDELGTGFSTVTTQSGGGVAPVSWGTNLFDCDNDADLDLYVTNGCLNPGLMPNPNLMLEDVEGSYRESGFISNTNNHSIGRGSVTFDYDNDGDLDLFVVNQAPYSDQDVGVTFESSRLYRNDTEGRHWLKVKLAGSSSETSGIGSRLTVYAGSKMLIREVDGGSSHQSQSSQIAHIGLGASARVDSLLVQWSSGRTQKFYDVPTDQLLTVKEADIVLALPEAVTGPWRLYPNPFENQINFTAPSGAGAVTVKVLSLTGETVYHRQFEAQEATGAIINLDYLSAGLYLVTVTSNRRTHQQRIVKGLP